MASDARPALLLGLLLSASCVSLGSKSWVCADGAPLKILTHPACTRGVCGYTCDPDRWTVPPPAPAPVDLGAIERAAQK